MVVTTIHVIRRVAVIKQSLYVSTLASNKIRWPHGVAREGKQAQYVCVKSICSLRPVSTEENNSTYQLYMTLFAYIGSAHMMPILGNTFPFLLLSTLK